MNKTNGIHYREAWGLWWPDYDAAPERTYAYVQKHLGDVDMTIAATPARRVCIQAGGHVGLWPLKLAQHFDHVLTFEPDPDLFRCLFLNCAQAPNIICSQAALGAARGHLKMLPHSKAGSWSINPHGTHLVNVETIDAVLAHARLEHCDALVLDIEGHEVAALKGAEQTIAAHRPVVHVEELRAHRQASARHMRSIGYTESQRAGHDALYTREGETC